MPDRVLLVGPTPPPAGGIATHVRALAGELACRRARVRALDPARGRAALAGALVHARTAGALVHAHVCGHNAGSFRLLGACVAMTPTLVTLHSGLAPAWLAGLSGAGRALAHALLARAAAVVCVSDALARAVGPRALVITPFLAAAARPGTPPAAARAARASAAPLLAAAVAPGPEYGADLLAAGFARFAAACPGAGLLLFGPGGADREVKRALAARGLADRAVALGELDHAAALGVIALADVLVRPTRADGDALAVREARALGRRVVASDAARRPAGVITFPAGDPAALAEAMHACLAAPPPPPTDGDADGLPALLALYRRLGVDLAEDP